MSSRGVVGEWIALAVRRARVFLLLESCALALAAAAIVLGAAVASGANARERDALLVAALAGVACGAMWFLERGRTPQELAHRADRKLEQLGALLTAFENEHAVAERPLVCVLIERVASALTPAAIARAVPWPSPAFAAAPLLAAAGVAFALQIDERTSRGDFELAGRLAVVAVSAARTASDAGAPSESVERVLASARDLERFAQARLLDRDQLARELAAVDEALSELANVAPAASAELRAARDLGHSAQASLASLDPERKSSSSSGSASAVASESLPPVANGSPARTMSRPGEPAEIPMTSPRSASALDALARAESGTIAGRWWEPRYDALVAEFLAAPQDYEAGR